MKRTLVVGITSPQIAGFVLPKVAVRSGTPEIGVVVIIRARIAKVLRVILAEIRRRVTKIRLLDV